MHAADAARATSFSDEPIDEVEQVTSSELEQIDDQVALIESFRQPFPLRERGKPVMDGEMDSYG